MTLTITIKQATPYVCFNNNKSSFVNTEDSKSDFRQSDFRQVKQDHFAFPCSRPWAMTYMMAYVMISISCLNTILSTICVTKVLYKLAKNFQTPLVTYFNNLFVLTLIFGSGSYCSTILAKFSFPVQN